MTANEPAKREIVLDTETTGLDPAAGHRIVEVGCVEIIGLVPSGEDFRRYVNPERDMPAEAEAIHGLSGDFLAGQPLFAEIADEFLDFIGDAPLVIHNAGFDMKFLNAELTRIGRPALDPARAVDTAAMARRRYPGSQASLDALCRRYEIDTSARGFHGALLDCQLLAEVYMELRGGRQPGFNLAKATAGGHADKGRADARPQRPKRPHAPSEEERRAHEALLSRLEDPVWRR